MRLHRIDDFKVDLYEISNHPLIRQSHCLPLLRNRELIHRTESPIPVNTVGQLQKHSSIALSICRDSFIPAWLLAIPALYAALLEWSVVGATDTKIHTVLTAFIGKTTVLGAGLASDAPFMTEVTGS